VKQLMTQLDSAFFKLLDELTIARSRKHILDYYNAETIGHFPLRTKPVNIYPKIDLLDRLPSYDALNDEILNYELAVFNPSRFLHDDHLCFYEAQAKLEGLPFTQSKAGEPPHPYDEEGLSQAARKFSAFIRGQHEPHHREDQHAGESHPGISKEEG
jgi:hypothetical protein